MTESEHAEWCRVMADLMLDGYTLIPARERCRPIPCPGSAEGEES